jgi:hypothetical protein
MSILRLILKINIVERNIKQNQQGDSNGRGKGQGKNGIVDYTPEELAEIRKHAEEVIAKHKNNPTGSQAEFVKKCDSSAKLDEHGISNGKI